MKKKTKPNKTQRGLTYSILYKCPMCEQTFHTENEIYTVSVDDSESDISFSRMFPRTTYTISFGITKEIAEHLYEHYHPEIIFPQAIAARGGIVYASDTLYDLDEGSLHY